MPSHIVQWHNSRVSQGIYAFNSSEDANAYAEVRRAEGYRVRILRVSPPVERRVEIDWAAVEKEVGLAFPQIRKEMFKRFILRHARIVEEPKL